MGHSDSDAIAAQFKDHSQSVNEIIVKIEMKKFQNLINNRLERKNNLVATDAGRVFPLSKIAEGSATAAQAPTKFEEGILKMHPYLFKYYEQMNKKGQSVEARKTS